MNMHVSDDLQAFLYTQTGLSASRCCQGVHEMHL